MKHIQICKQNALWLFLCLVAVLLMAPQRASAQFLEIDTNFTNPILFDTLSAGTAVNVEWDWREINTTVTLLFYDSIYAGSPAATILAKDVQNSAGHFEWQIPNDVHCDHCALRLVPSPDGPAYKAYIYPFVIRTSSMGIPISDKSDKIRLRFDQPFLLSEQPVFQPGTEASHYLLIYDVAGQLLFKKEIPLTESPIHVPTLQRAGTPYVIQVLSGEHITYRALCIPVPE